MSKKTEPIKIQIGSLTLHGQKTEDTITITSASTGGDLLKSLLKLIGVSTIDNDSTDKSTELVRASVDDMALVQGAPLGGPNLGLVNHLGQSTLAPAPIAPAPIAPAPIAPAPISIPTIVPAGTIAPQIVHASGEVQLALPLSVEITAAASTPTITGFSAPTSPIVVDTTIQPPVISNPSAALTELRHEQQEVVNQFEVVKKAPLEVPLDPNVKFDISALPADKQLSITTTFQKAGGIQVEQLRGNLPQATGLPPANFASLTPEQVLNMIWNILVREKISK